jgi:hypothetical protein
MLAKIATIATAIMSSIKVNPELNRHGEGLNEWKLNRIKHTPD